MSYDASIPEPRVSIGHLDASYMPESMLLPPYAPEHVRRCYANFYAHCSANGEDLNHDWATRRETLNEFRFSGRHFISMAAVLVGGIPLLAIDRIDDPVYYKTHEDDPYAHIEYAKWITRHYDAVLEWYSL